MRMKRIVENRTLKSAAAEFLAFKRAQKIRERTLLDYQKYINPFVEQSSNSMDINVLKREILDYLRSANLFCSVLAPEADSIRQLIAGVNAVKHIRSLSSEGILAF